MADTPWTESVTAQPCSCGHPGCDQYILSTQRSSGFSKGDALLYAAAPDMAETLIQLIVIAMDNLDGMDAETRAECERDVKAARAALAKARGQQLLREEPEREEAFDPTDPASRMYENEIWE